MKKTGAARVEKLEMWERSADGLDMPDDARMTLGLAPRPRPWHEHRRRRTFSCHVVRFCWTAGL
jgi:hypothetical protein